MGVEEEEIGSKPIPEVSQFKDRIFSKIEKEISEDDLTSPGVVRLIIADNEKLSEKVKSLEVTERSYYQEQKLIGKLEEKENRKVSYEVLYDFSIAIGGILAGLSTYDFGKALSINNWILLGLAGIFVVSAVLSKWVKR